MGWFDKKSWRLRRKIKDLQADLRDAEKDGKYIVEQGLFFAELEDMGEMTMMVFGASQEFSSSEESVIRAFFDRNGFSVETLKLDKTKTGLAEVEIIPPEELTRAIGRTIKSEGYRLIDDSETERPANQTQKIYPLSSLVRAIVVLFAERVQQVTSSTRVKMNKEGNRLLHWMPKIIEALNRKVENWAVELARPAFEDAYEMFYGRIGHSAEVSPARAAASSSPTAGMDASQRIPAISFPARDSDTPRPLTPPPFQPYRAQSPLPSATAAPALNETPPMIPEEMPAPASLPAAASGPSSDLVAAMKAHDLAEAKMNMYKSLVKASSNRCVKNSESLLMEVNRFFSAAATCLMVKVPNGHGLTIHAQAGKKLVWGEGGGQGYAVSSTVLGECVRSNKVVTSDDREQDPTQSMVAHKIESTAAAPICINDEIVGILYIDRRSGLQTFTDEDRDRLAQLADIFRDYPDLTLGLPE